MGKEEERNNKTAEINKKGLRERKKRGRRWDIIKKMMMGNKKKKKRRRKIEEFQYSNCYKYIITKEILTYLREKNIKKG